MYATSGQPAEESTLLQANIIFLILFLFISVALYCILFSYHAYTVHFLEILAYKNYH
jgi:hypothetical protein